jgi:hypothetical protein
VSRLRGRVVLAAASAAATIFAVEAALQAAAGAWRPSVVEEMRGRGLAVTPTVLPRSFVDTRSSVMAGARPLVPLAGLSRRLTVACREGGGELVFQSDEHGFHNPAGAWARPALDVAVLGDSHALGICVPSGEEVAATLRRVHPALLNLGYSGNGPLLSLAALKEYLPARRPAHVVWLYYAGNDLHDLREERAHPVLTRYLEPGFRLGVEDRQDAIDTALAAAADDGRARPRWHRLLDVARLRALRARIARARTPPAPTSEDVAALRGVLVEVQRTAAGWGGAVAFVYLPSWSELFEPQPGQDELRRNVLALASAAGMRVVDTTPDLQARGPTAFACRRTCHYSAAGYGVVAARVLAALGGSRSVSSQVPLGARSAS